MAVAAVDQALVRLEVARSTILDLHARFLQELRDLGIKAPAADPADDNLAPLVGTRDILHDALVDDCKLLSRWVARRRELADPEVWADRMVESTWPPRGINEDVPCADVTSIRKLCEWQIGPLITMSILNDTPIAQAAAAKVEAFARQVATALAPPCQPRNELGDPSQGIRAGDLFVVAPKLAAQHFDPALQNAPWTIPVLWTSSPEARVLFIRTWEGYTVAEILRAAQLATGGAAEARP